MFVYCYCSIHFFLLPSKKLPNKKMANANWGFMCTYAYKSVETPKKLRYQWKLHLLLEKEITGYPKKDVFVYTLKTRKIFQKLTASTTTTSTRMVAVWASVLVLFLHKNQPASQPVTSKVKSADKSILCIPLFLFHRHFSWFSLVFFSKLLRKNMFYSCCFTTKNT